MTKQIKDPQSISQHILHEEWSESVEPGAYYPPQDGNTVSEVTMMEVD